MMFKARFKVAESPDVFCAELSSLMARNGHADSVAQCPLSGAKRKTFARIELFRFWTHLRHGPEHPLPDPAGALAAARTKTAQLGTDGYLLPSPRSCKSAYVA